MTRHRGSDHVRLPARSASPLDHPYLADTINVAPDERYPVLVRSDELGVWVWHCQILSHVDWNDGMFGMVTGVIF
ncbi:MAG TPA: multicopper oxidase domain-containing protein [Acidimicrobiales bacterium]|nr:multicopper oxidase domain-containing protein [Actinomycetes bacterium]HJM72557.1 multicopper oxidase domain-containing protein [Acidimicrobiales bacterium]